MRYAFAIGATLLAGCAVQPVSPPREHPVSVPAVASIPAPASPAAAVETYPVDPAPALPAPEPTREEPGTMAALPSSAAIDSPTNDERGANIAPADPAPPTKPAIVTWRRLAAVNDERLLDVYPGIAREQVERMMDLRREGRPLNPYRREMLRDAGGNVYHVLHYITREPGEGRPIRDNHLTPVIFLGDKVYAMGRYQLKKLKRTACVVRSATGACVP